jgi:hypothetical protein
MPFAFFSFNFLVFRFGEGHGWISEWGMWGEGGWPLRSLRRCSWSEGGQLLTDHMPRVVFAIGSLAVVLGVGHEWGRKWGTQGEARGPLRSWGGTRVLQVEASPSATNRAASMTSLSIVLFSFSSVLPFGTSVKQLEETPEEGRS